jgi:hypothetical protein
VSGVGNIVGIKVDLYLDRGNAPATLTGAPTNSRGGLRYHPSFSSDHDFFVSETFLSGRLYLPEPIFDELWYRIRSNIPPSTVHIEVSPTHDHENEDRIWNLEESKTLFILNAKFSFVLPARSKV